ncbi:phage gp6-like head-tail connector protein [Paenibacillus melissococcoides]|uniref:Phage gp6-like head-tail connector protein n=1 Tax=Paenibacillus melissococcoides TaxID=2912268 RepID=A0ABN8UC11_9BACL|nr:MULTISPECIES: phage gp6-like head-tail connector protein [Paenibacillus]MEB9896767.1 phage gp6-like head-tail connector protein [Bacillus cereus]CAH8248615.1 phage gp6-like head-tail connector protein [Paenibacillus melissococcoides]CAH8714240.1 phage gp6-like head-tail connector protein [Paenibacillus melissococcoides]CAH8719992.1 phage gp6-like head-tail connector protein [Paenibacillus melissococcoides]GIO79553.1 hypothetical protein J6TS7_31630 [Paenibacillus dendritiformis]
MLTTLERLKGLLGPEAETWGDDMLMLHIASVSAAIENYCKRNFKKQLYTERVSGYASSRYINLRNYPVHQITQISAVSDYDILDDGRLYCPAGWPTGDHNIEVSYIGGYVLPSDAMPDEPRTLPEPLEIACLMYAKSLCERQFIPVGIQKEQLGEMSVTYAQQQTDKDMPPVVTALITPYVGRWY